MTTVIKGGTIITHDLTYAADVVIEGGVITAIGPDMRGDSVIDATGAYVMPGGIDPHTHLEMPFMGTSTAETWESGTFAAASGGTTMIVDHIISSPTDLLGPLALWEERAARQASIDYGFHMSITGWSKEIWEQMAQCVDRGVNTFKHFMAYKGALMVNDDEMFASFTRCRELGAIPLVHAENGDLIAGLQQKLLAEGNRGPEAHAYSRPATVEGEATNRAIMIADAVGVPVYIVHTSSEEAHEAIRRWKQAGTRVWGEPLIQHLLLDETEYQHPDWNHAAQRVMSPPFRDKRHQDSLWAGLAAGTLSVVATDHCAFTTKQKQMGRGDFTKIPNGTGGLEDRLSLLWTHGVATGRITMNEFVAVTSTNIAQILNIYPRKGAISVGADADIVVFDPKATKTITAATQKSAIDYNVFEGFTVTGLPRYTLSRGTIVWGPQGGKPQPGRGQHIRRTANPPISRAYSQWRDLIAPRPVTRDETLMPIESEMKKIMCAFGTDIDSVAGWIGSYGGGDSPSDIQRGIFATEVGIPRLLRLFKKYDLKTSFFIPGHSLETFPKEMEMIVRDGHEVGAHGYLHENPIAMTPTQEEDVLVKSIDLIKDLTGKAPRGYVAPWWEMSANTAALLLKHGFEYDHSQGYRDFQPFYARVGDSWNTIDYTKQAKDWMHPLKHGHEIDLVDIAANWYVDDLPPMMFMKKAPNSHGFVNPRDIEEMWRDQFDWVYREMDYAVFAFTIHPDVAGRPQVLLMLERLIEYISKHSDVEWLPFEDIARDFRARYPFAGTARPPVI